jgi:DNA-directed RNA polymerase specialized sigma24 family protein
VTGGDSKTRGGFPHTRWSLVAQASGGADDAAASAALNELLRAYCPVLNRHLVCVMNFTPHAADDLVQDFVAHKILRKNILSGANRTRGRFRVYLLTAFKNFVIGEIRRRKALKRGPLGDGALSLDELPEAAVAAKDSHRALDLDWARQTLAMAVERMREECRGKDRRDLWDVFSCRILEPALDQAPVPSYETLVSRFGFESPTQASNLLITARRNIRRALEGVVRDTVADESQVEREIRDLKAILSE